MCRTERAVRGAEGLADWRKRGRHMHTDLSGGGPLCPFNMPDGRLDSRLHLGFTSHSRFSLQHQLLQHQLMQGSCRAPFCKPRGTST